MRTLSGTLVVVALAATPWRPLPAQWGISAERGVARFGGTSRDSSGATVGPYRPTTFGLRLDRTLGRARVAVDILYAKTGLAGEERGVAVVQYGTGSLWDRPASSGARRDDSASRSVSGINCRAAMHERPG